MLKSIFILQLLLLLNCAILVPAYSQERVVTKNGSVVLLYSDGTWKPLDSVPKLSLKPVILTNLEIPFSASKDVITQSEFALSYNYKHKLSNWIAYELTAKETQQVYSGVDDFKQDPLIKRGFSNEKDYKSGIINKTQLAPPRDFTWSIKAISECFYYSNVVPVVQGFDYNSWQDLEALTRDWAIENDKVFVVTGPILSDDLTVIGSNKIALPKSYFKVVLDYSEPITKGIGFLIPNSASSKSLSSYAVSIDSLERLSGLDFFPSLPDQQEHEIERNYDLNLWTWTPSKMLLKQSNTQLLCKALLNSGKNCNIPTYNSIGFCYQHLADSQSENPTSINKYETQRAVSTQTSHNNPRSSNSSSNTSTTAAKTVQCSGLTKARARCKRMTTNPNGRCFQH